MAGSDIYLGNTVLRMHMTGTENGTSFAEGTGKSITIVGAKTKTSQLDPFGASTGVGYFDGSGYLTAGSSAGFSLGTGDFTIEFWIRPALSSAYQNILSTGAYSTGQVSVRLNLTDRVEVYVNTTAGSIYTNPLSLNTWVHIAICRASGTTRIYRGGTMDMSTTATWDATSTGTLTVSGATSALNGYLSDLRITKGVARYTGSTYTVPTEPFPDISVAISGTVRDSSAALTARTVRGYRRSDGALAGEVVSNGTTGAFVIPTLDTSAHYAICLPSSATENALIFDNITPI